MKHVIVSGDSFTDPNYKSQTNPDHNTNYKKWPDYINADNIINLGKSGADNVSIINVAIKNIYKSPKKIDSVVIALSNWFRFALPHNVGSHDAVNPDWAYNFSTPEKETVFMKNSYMQWLVKSNYFKHNYEFNVGYCRNYNWNVSYNNVMEYAIEQTTFYLIKLLDICKSHNIKLYVFQMIEPIVDRPETTQKFIKTLINNYWFKQLEISKDINLIGWPFFKEIGGMVVDDMLKQRHVISDLDTHPNELGHKLIGDWFNENVKI